MYAIRSYYANHGIFQSIYFFDPNGHRLELVANTCTQEQIDELRRVSYNFV